MLHAEVHVIFSLDLLINAQDLDVCKYSMRNNIKGVDTVGKNSVIVIEG